MTERLAELTARLAGLAPRYDATGGWPQKSLEAFGAAGGWPFAVPRAWGGDGLTAGQQLEVYQAIARGDVSVALIITQRDGAIDLIASGDNETLKRELLPRYARGQRFTTVGISQITTSRQGGKPAMTVTPTGDELIFSGVMPWATGADHADEIVAAGVTADGAQVLASMPVDAPGVSVEAPVQLMALQSSRTSLVRCDRVRVARERLIRGPRDNVLARRSPVKNWVTSSVGCGLAAGMLDRIRARRDQTPADLLRTADHMEARLAEIRAQLMTYAAGDADVDKTEVDAVRVSINDLLIRLSGIMMTIVKGSGYLTTDPAQRLAREALFFCVWSAPDAIRTATASRLAGM